MKTLRRSITNRTIGGVCGGIAEYFNIDPVLVRLIFVVLAVFGGAGVILYVIAWIVMPEQSISDRFQDAEIVDDAEKKTDGQFKKEFDGVKEDLKQSFQEVEKEIEKVEKELKKHKYSSGGWFGFLLVFLGLAFLLRTFGWVHFSWYGIWQYWPIFLIFIGISVIPMKRWLKNTLMAFCFAGLLLALMFNSHTGRPRYSVNWRSNYSVNTSNTSRNVLAVTTSREGENANLKIDAGACKLNLSEITEHLSAVWLNDEKMSFVEFTNESEQRNKFKTEVSTGKRFSPRVDLALNENPIWDVELNVGAASVNMDLSEFKMENVRINSGAADIDLKLGQKHAKTKVNISTGASSIRVRIPKDADCKVISSSFLMSKKLDGFSKSGGVYQTKNFGSAAQTITIEIDGAISNFNVARY